MSAELRYILWTIKSLRDLHLDNVEIWSDSSAAIKDISYPRKWPRYQGFLGQI